MERSTSTQRPGWQIALAWLAVMAALAAGFYQHFRENWKRWFPAWDGEGLGLYGRIVEGESYYTHGPLIPIISLLAMIMIIRHTKVPLRPRRRAGCIVLAAGLLMHLAASAGLIRVNFVSGFALIVVLAGLVLLLWGGTALRRLWFPLALLAFMVPLPEVSIYQLNFRLKMMAAQIGVHASGLLGIIVERSGNQVFLEGGKSMVIANVCNGLRTLISMVAFGALYAYICKLRGFWRLLLFGLSVPVAVIVNSIRIVSLILVADIWDVATATGWYHDTSGLLIFVLAFLMMFGLEKLILWLRKVCGRPAEVRPIFDGIAREDDDQDQWPRLAGAFSGRAVWLAVVALALTAAAVAWLGRTSSSARHFQMAKQMLPTELTIDGQRWHSYDLPLDKRSLTILEFPHYLLRHYQVGRTEIEFCLVFSRDNRLGVHPPDVCLEGGGQDIISKADLLLTCSPGGKTVMCRELITQDGASRQYFLYTYKCGPKYSCSFWRQQLFIMLNGLTRSDSAGALLRVSMKMDDEAQARQRCRQLLQTLVPLLDQALP